MPGLIGVYRNSKAFPRGFAYTPPTEQYHRDSGHVSCTLRNMPWLPEDEKKESSSIEISFYFCSKIHTRVNICTVHITTPIMVWNISILFFFKITKFY